MKSVFKAAEYKTSDCGCNRYCEAGTFVPTLTASLQSSQASQPHISSDSKTIQQTLEQAAEMLFDPYCDLEEDEVKETLEANPPVSAFLRLPGELRNHIYRDALLETDNIKVRKHTKPAQPGILQVDRQCRKESADIYYQENTFAFQVTHFDAAVYISWCKSSDRRRWCQTVAHMSRSQNWANLVVWLEAYWRKECGGPLSNEDGKANADAKAATHLFVMVKKLRESGALSWDQSKDILESAHSAISEVKPRWSWRTTGMVDMVASVQ